MTSLAQPIAGTIAIQPLRHESGERWTQAADDSSLAALLASFAHCESLEDGEDPDSASVERMVTSTRWSRNDAPTENSTIKADLVRLVAELETQYDLLRQM